MKRKNRQLGSRNSAKPSSKREKQDDATATSKATRQPAKTKKASRRQKNAVFAEQTAALEWLQTSYRNHRAGYHAENRSFIADTARWTLGNRSNPEVIDWLKSHEFWGDKKAPKNVMQAAMAFMAGRRSKLAQKRQRIVDFLLGEGCEPENLEEALKEGIEPIYSRATKADPKRKKTEPAKAETKGDKTSKPKHRPVYFTGTAVEKLNGLQNGDRVRVTMEVEDVKRRLLKIVKATPLTK